MTFKRGRKQSKALTFGLLSKVFKPNTRVADMLKRTCPFGESSVPSQTKTHVGQKEVAQGVDGEKYMKEIHEKTLAMMFASQKQLSKDEMNLAASLPASTMPTHPSNGHQTNVSPLGCHDNGCSSSQMELLPGQCLLDEHGKIIVGHTVPAKPKQAEQTMTPTCCTCCKATAAVMIRCYSCEKLLCPNCTRPCRQCANKFCVMCSMINFDESYDRIFCLGCSSQIK